MKLFNFNKKNNEPKLVITQTDRAWVEDSFRWLIQFYGYPSRSSEQIILNESFFPNTFKTEQIEVEHVIADLCALLELNSKNITIEYQEDIRNSTTLPYEIEGSAFESELFPEQDCYTILIANSLVKHPKRLIYSLAYECIQIRLYESGLEPEPGEDISMLTYIAGIYLGFGVLISQNLVDCGKSDDGLWETKWAYVSDMQEEVMAFALASYAKLTGQENPSWKLQLPADLQKHFDHACTYLNEYPSELFDKSALDANDLFLQSNLEYEASNYNAAISTLQKVLFLTEDDFLKADVYNNIGYYQIRKGDLLQSISSFRKALELDPDAGFTNDNLGYALIRTGSYEEGKLFLEKALQALNNDPAYTYRNRGLYYQMKGDIRLAEKYFQLAFEYVTIPVDLLEFHYSEFLFSQEKEDEAMKYLQIAVDKGEPEAIARMKHWKANRE